MTIDDFEKAYDYSAYKAGGGDAARAQGKSVEDIIAQGRKNIESYDGQRNDPRTSINQPEPGSPLEQFFDTVKDIAGKTSDVFNGLTDGLEVLADVKGAIKTAEKYGGLEPPGPGEYRPTIIAGAPGSVENPVERTLSPGTNRELSRGIDPSMTPSELRNAVQANINKFGISTFNPGAKGTLNNLTKDPYFNDNGDLVIDDTYAFDPGGDIGQKSFPFFGTTGNFARSLSFGNKQMERSILTKFDQSIGAIMPGTPDENDPIVNIRINVPSSFIKKGVRESRIVSREKRRRILREVKQPYMLPEVKKEKYKPNFAGKFRAQNTPDVTASKQSDDMIRAKNSDGQIWRTHDKYWAGYETTERMNVLQDRVGHGQWYFDSITSSNAQDYEKITERFKGALKDRDLQEHLNTLAHEKAMREMQSDYISPFREKKVVQEQETIQADNDPLMKKVIKRLKTEIDYPDKPSAAGYPNDPPPQLDPVTGMHPEYGKLGNRYNSLDPHSAETMSKAPTGDPDIDAKVQKARRLKSVKSVSNNASPKLETPLKKRTKKKT